MSDEASKKLGDNKDHIMHPDDRAGASGPWLETKLKDKGIAVIPSSGIAGALGGLKSLRHLVLSKESTGTPTIDELFKFFSEAYGADFLTKAIHWGYDSGLSLSSEQWEQLVRANPNIATPGISNVDRNKVWETVIGSIAKTFCSHVDFDEPDLTCQFGDKKIAIAAKMIYAEKKIIRRIIEGFKQAKLANEKREVDAYLIFVNVVNIYPFIDVFRWTAKTQISSDELKKVLLKEVTEWCDRLPLVQQAMRFAKETNKPVGVGFFIPFTLVFNGNPMPFFYLHMPLIWAKESDEYLFAQKFLQACNIVLGYPHN